MIADRRVERSKEPVFDATGNLYVAETGAGRILRITGDY
jgi:hypothetical protein